MNISKIENILSESFKDMYANFIDKMLLNNSVSDYIAAFILFLVFFLSIQLFRAVLIVWVEKIAKKTKTKIDDFIVKTLDKKRRIFFTLISFIFAIETLVLAENIKVVFDNIIFVLCVIEVTKIIIHAIEFLFDRYLRTHNKTKKAAYYAIINIIRIIIWSVVLLFVVSNFGINITSIITGFGVIGIAVAFAFQSILKDLFSYITILLDRPVDIGDYVKIDDKKGIIERIGIKTTRLKSIDGGEVIIPNTSLTEKKIDNFGKSNYRRVVHKVRIPLETKVEMIKKIKKELIRIAKSHSCNKIEHCNMSTIGDYFLEFDLVYRITPRNYYLYVNIKESINLSILKYFEKEKIMFAYPAEIIINKEAGNYQGYIIKDGGIIGKL